MKLKINRRFQRELIEALHDAAEPLPDREIYVREKLRRRYRKGNFQGDPVMVYCKDNPPALKSEREIRLDLRKFKLVKRVKKKDQSAAPKVRKAPKPVKRGAYQLPPLNPFFDSNKGIVPTIEYVTKVPLPEMWQRKSSKFAVMDAITGKMISEHRTEHVANTEAAKWVRRGTKTQVYERH